MVDNFHCTLDLVLLLRKVVDNFFFCFYFFGSLKFPDSGLPFLTGVVLLPNSLSRLIVEFNQTRLKYRLVGKHVVDKFLSRTAIV